MDDAQGDRIIDLLETLVDELRGLRGDFLEFTGYNVYKMSVAIDDIGDRIAGGVAGIGGATLDEVKSAIEAVESAIALK
jgi:hypothetical protein